MTATVTIRGRECWLVKHVDWQGKPLFLAETIWKHNAGYIYTTTQYDATAEDALLRLYDAIRHGIA